MMDEPSYSNGRRSRSGCANSNGFMKNILFLLSLVSSAMFAQPTTPINNARLTGTTVATGNFSVIGSNWISPVASIAALRAVNATSITTNTSVHVFGYYAANDGSDGDYYWNAASAAADNGGTVIQPTSTSGNGRWLLIVIGNVVTVDQFGAKGDWNGSSGTDDRARIQAALTWAGSTTRATVVLNAKTYAISDYLSINSNYVKFVGCGQNTSRLIVTDGANDAIRVGSGAGPSIAVPTLGDFAISRSVVATGGTGISLIKTSLAKIHDIQVDGFQNAFYFSGATNSNVSRCVASCGTTAVNFIGFRWDGGQTGTTILGAASSQMFACVVDATGCSGTSKGLLIDGNGIADVYVYDLGTLNCSYGKLVDGSRATSAPVIAANGAPYNWDISFINCTDDQYKVHGTFISQNALIGAITIKSGWSNPGATSGIGSGIYVQNSRGVTIDGVQIMNIGQLSTARGITVDGSSNVQIKTCQIIDLNFAVYLLNSTLCAVDGNTAFNQSTRTGSTAFLCSGATRNKIIGNTVDGYNSVGISSDAASLCGNNLIGFNHVNPDHVTTKIVATGATGGSDISVNNIIL